MIPPGLTTIATGRTVIFALLLWLGAGLVLFQLGPYDELTLMAPGLEPLDERMGYAWTDVQVYFAVLGEAGRRLYRVFLVADLGNAILMASAVTLLLVFLTARLGLERTWIGMVAFIPIVSGALDLVENTLLLIMLGRFPDLAESLTGAASTITTLKLVSVLAGATLVVLGIFGWAATMVRRGSARS